MRKTSFKNSKKGLTLPVAIVISVVLVILAAGLILIAISSISTTTATVNGRQAYMNVRSALEYAESYYSHKVSDYAKIGKATADGKRRVEYLSVREKSTAAGAVTYYEKGDDSVISGSDTYVEAEYSPSSVTGDKPSLKLTGFAQYSDNLGNKGKWVTLSITYDIGSAGSQNRVTIINYPASTTVAAPTDTIRLNLKLPVDFSWKVCYYIWTYKDTGNAYSGWNGASYVYNDDNTRKNPNVSDLNTSQQSGNSTPVNGAWDGNNGAVGRMVKQSGGWYAGDYKINSNYVNFFNVIFAKEGATVEHDGHYDSQTEEIFHLWYLNPDDKNIYFEFLNNKKQSSTVNSGNPYYIRYLVQDTGWDWNGYDSLDDTVLVYLKNQKITVHFRAEKENDNKVTNEDVSSGQTPIITTLKNSDGSAITGHTFLKSGGIHPTNSAFGYIESTEAKQTSNIPMTYEGCGWWVANIESNKVFDVSISYMGKSYDFNNVRAYADSSSPDASLESWLILKDWDVLNTKYGSMEAHQTENTALDALGVARTSYVTVHAKGYNPDELVQPVLKYAHNILDSSTGRQKLYEKILEAFSLPQDDYEKTSYDKLLEVRKKAINVYDNKNPDGSVMKDASGNTIYFINNPIKYDGTTSFTATTEVGKADEAYQTYIDALNDAITALVPATVDQATLTALKKNVDEAQEIHDHIDDYDVGYHADFETSFNAAKTFYDSAKDLNNVNLKKQDAKDKSDDLANQITKIKAQKLDRQTLNERITYANKLKDDSKYIESYRTALAEKIAEAQTAYNTSKQTKTGLETALNNLNAAITNVENHLAPVESSTESSAESSTESSGTEPPTPVVDTTALETQKTRAIDLLNNSQNYTHETRQALLTAQAAAAVAPTTQTEADNMTKELQAANDRFIVMKPDDTNAELAQEKKIRVWFINDTSLSYKMYNVKEDGAEIIIAGPEYHPVSGVSSSTPNYYYFDVDTNLAVKIKVEVTDEAGAVKSAVLDIPDDNNLFINVDASHNITAKKLATLYIPRYDADRNQITNLQVKFNNEVYNYVTSKFYANETGHTDSADNTASGDNYFVYRYVYDAATPISIVTYPSNKQYDVSGVSLGMAAGEYVLRFESVTGKVQAINVNNIYPSFTTPSEPTDPTASPTVVTTENYQITQVIDSASVSDMLTSVPMDSTKKRVIFDITGHSEFNSYAPRIYLWYGGGHDEGKEENTWDSSSEMKRYGTTNYYYYDFDRKYTSCIINNVGNGSVQTQEILLTDTTSSGEDAYFYLVTAKGNLSGDGSGSNCDTVRYNIYGNISGGGGGGGAGGGTPTPTPVTLGDDEYAMAYVGGAKIRIKNKSYMETYPSGTKPKNDNGQEMHTDWKFGGIKVGGINMDYYQKRVGDAKLLPYFDWYEYKIPLEQSNTYSLEVTGLNYTPSNSANNYAKDVKTSVINEVYGDVWVSLFNDVTYNDSGTVRFTNTEILTFDPDKTQIGSELSLYMRVPNVSTKTTTDTDSVTGHTFETKATTTWHTPQISKAHGTGTTKVNIGMTALARQNTIYKSNSAISKNTPFITLSIIKETTYVTTEKDATGAIVGTTTTTETETKTYKEKLMGGTYVLFNPSKNNEYGGWEKFQSDQDNLIDICDTLVNMYYGKYLINGYDSSGEMIDNDKTESSYLESIISGYAGGTTKYFARSNGSSSGLWVTNSSEIEAKTDETTLYNDYNAIKAIVEKMEALYSQMDLARSYIETPITNQNGYHSKMTATSRYPQYLNRGNTRQYTGISDLTDKLAAAETAYITGNNLDNARWSLDRALANISVSSEGSIAVVLYDAQGKVAQGHKFEIRYNTKDASGNKVTHTPAVIADSELNPEGYPLKFIKGVDTIYDVQFYDKTAGKLLGDTKDEMKVNEAWVFMDYSDAEDGTTRAFWRENAATDYRQIMTDTLVQGSDVDVLFQMNTDPATGEYEPMTIYFTYDTTVRYSGGDYVVKAGPYTFVDSKNYKTQNMPGAITSELDGKIEMPEKTSASGGEYYQSVLLYFPFDTNVTYGNVAAGTSETYTIMAGAYPFLGSDIGADSMPIEQETNAVGEVSHVYVNLLTETAKDYFSNNRPSLPVSNGQVSLFNNAAKNFFTSDANYGRYAGALDATIEADGLNWNYIQKNSAGDMLDENGNVTTDADKANRLFATGNRITTKGDVNMDVSKGSFTLLPVTTFYSYSTNGGMSFRWSSANPLYCKSGVKLYASEFKFAAVGTIDATQYGTSQTKFYLYDYNGGDEMEIEFFTDVNVAYLDSTGLKQQFVIREGKYRIEKDYLKDAKGNVKKDAAGEPIGKTDYIANLFDKQYWTSMEKVHPLSQNGLDDSNGGAGLSNPTYGN